ncbi:MAG: hypothetical protein ACLRWM_08885 [Streptococcus sp.]
MASIEAFEEQLDLIKVALKDNDERLLKDLFIKSSLRREIREIIGLGLLFLLLSIIY